MLHLSEHAYQDIPPRQEYHMPDVITVRVQTGNTQIFVTRQWSRPSRRTVPDRSTTCQMLSLSEFRQVKHKCLLHLSEHANQDVPPRQEYHMPDVITVRVQKGNTQCLLHLSEHANQDVSPRQEYHMPDVITVKVQTVNALHSYRLLMSSSHNWKLCQVLVAAKV